MSRKPNNPTGAAGKHGIPGPAAAAFFDQYTHEFQPGRGKIINGEPVDANQNRTIRRWRAGQNANRHTINKLLWDLGFTSDWFDRWLESPAGDAAWPKLP